VIVAWGIADIVGFSYFALGPLPVVVFVAYHATFLRVWSGETPGCRMMGIRIVSMGKSADLTTGQCVWRPVALITWLFLGLLLADEFELDAIAFLPAFLNVMMMTSLPSRQSLQDLVCRTVVVRSPPLQPHRAPAAPMFSVSDAEFGYRPRSKR